MDYELTQSPEPDGTDMETSNALCEGCGGKILVWEEKAGGICSDCYWKAVDNAR